MKKFFILLFAVLSVMSLAACSGENAADGESSSHVASVELESSAGDVIEIKEKMFATQINEIYNNSADYIGKKIKYEGFFDRYYYEEMDITYMYVMRNGPGCCGTDANPGFEVILADDGDYPVDDGDYPENDEWCEACGTLEEYDEFGEKYLRIRLESLTVLDERGADTVMQ